ncbi:hypothetical protein EST38_g10125 [Candolleomyces aberdarensis]|uniref:Uncharacterized protein n=1 Tax=Candolleomyces aberdarensis TaxID=2316362 RepID=A0A4Q2D866_9AGAR|nr:hypothetical protein EST38_g10125 [Candolleomyces aberdarensis]
MLMLAIIGASSITNTVKFNVGFTIPDVVNFGAENSFSTTVSNEQSKTSRQKSGKIQTLTQEFENSDGKKCRLQVETKTCRATASGKIPVVAKGYVWFNFADKRASKKNPKGGKHFKYSANIEKILSPSERTSYIEIQGPVNMVSKAGYDTNCVPIGKRKGSKASKKSAKGSSKPKAKPSKKSTKKN